ncbi:MAG: hypothetical protein ACXW32_10355 [Limisphaerales bacterium]
MRTASLAVFPLALAFFLADPAAAQDVTSNVPDAEAQNKTSKRVIESHS